MAFVLPVQEALHRVEETRERLAKALEEAQRAMRRWAQQAATYPEPRYERVVRAVASAVARAQQEVPGLPEVREAWEEAAHLVWALTSLQVRAREAGCHEHPDVLVAVERAERQLRSAYKGLGLHGLLRAMEIATGDLMVRAALNRLRRYAGHIV